MSRFNKENEENGEQEADNEVDEEEEEVGDDEEDEEEGDCHSLSICLSPPPPLQKPLSLSVARFHPPWPVICGSP